jgi:hypothetical protein
MNDSPFQRFRRRRGVLSVQMFQVFGLTVRSQIWFNSIGVEHNSAIPLKADDEEKQKVNNPVLAVITR